jgi:lipopolysaccharide export system protein LptA
MRYVLALVLLGLTAPALAEAPPGKAREPINVTADSFTAEKVPVKSGPGVINGTYSGNVTIVQGNVRMRADSVRVLMVGGHAEKAFAQGHIVIVSPNSGTATGDSGIYEVGPRIATLTGHVVLTKEKNVMRGPQLTVNLVTGVAKLGGAGGVSGTHGQVQASFDAPPQSGGK